MMFGCNMIEGYKKICRNIRYGIKIITLFLTVAKEQSFTKAAEHHIPSQRFPDNGGI